MKTCTKCQRIYRTDEDFLFDTEKWRVGADGALYFECSCQATQFLPKGSYQWYSPSRFLRNEVLEIFKSLGLGEMIPSPPAELIALRSACNDMTLSTSELAAIVKKEPVICSDLLRMSDVVAARRGNKIRTVEHAIAYVGRRTVADLLGLAALRSRVFVTKEFKSEVFWREALTCGVIAEELTASHPSHLSPDEAYIAGCLCNIGKAIGAICYAEVTDRVFLRSERDQLTWSAAEKIEEAVDHAILGEIASVMWCMPRFVTDTSAFHHSMKFENLPSRKHRGMIVIGLANQITHAVLNQNHRIDRGLAERFCDAIGQSSDSSITLENLVERCAPLVRIAEQALGQGT